jgi:lipooligosaccharide transport system permease protein
MALSVGVMGVMRPNPAQAARVWYRHALSWLRFYRTSILLNFVEPITGLVALGIGLGSYVHLINGISFIQFIAPGLVAVTAMNAVTFDSLFSTYNFLHENKVYPSMITSPLTVDDVAMGTILWQATRSLMYGGTFLIIITAFGLVHSWTALLVLPLLVLSGFMFAAPAICVASIAKVFEQMFYYITLCITPMFMFSGIFFPPTRLPHGVQVAIWFTPLYHVAHLARSFVLGQMSPDLLIDIAWIAVFTAIAMLFPVPLIRRKLMV